jgi:iron complex outermembrane receptor protein
MAEINHTTARGALLAAVALAALGSAGAGRAATAAADTGAIQVQEVVVTALKRDTTLLNAPAAVSAISAAKLQSEEIRNLSDLAQGVPSLQVGDAA